MVNTKFQELIIAAKRIGVHALDDASTTDNVNSFPTETLKEIEAAGLLIAAVSSRYGGYDVGLLPFTNTAMLTILKNIGSGNLVMGRVLEGHMNAQILINKFGTAAQQKQFANDAFSGKLFGVWNTQADDGTFLKMDTENSYILNGSKTFATGTDYVSRPIVTASLEDGSWQMCVVPMDKIKSKSDSSWWHPMGMRSSRSYKMTFENAEIPNTNILGVADSYYQQPDFSGGAIRFAAVQLGAAERLLDETRIYLRSLGRTEDPYQKIRVGDMTIAVISGNQWVTGAAEMLDNYLLDSTEKNSQKFLAYTNMMRTAIEQICLDVITLCQKCVGARGLNHPYHFERIIRDLSTYLRQPAPDLSLADVGRYVLQTDIPVSELWENNKATKYGH